MGKQTNKSANTAIKKGANTSSLWIWVNKDRDINGGQEDSTFSPLSLSIVYLFSFYCLSLLFLLFITSFYCLSLLSIVSLFYCPSLLFLLSIFYCLSLLYIVYLFFLLFISRFCSLSLPVSRRKQVFSVGIMSSLCLPLIRLLCSLPPDSLLWLISPSCATEIPNAFIPGIFCLLVTL